MNCSFSSFLEKQILLLIWLIEFLRICYTKNKRSPCLLPPVLPIPTPLRRSIQAPPIMHTVIRWRRPSEIESSRYPAGDNPCNHLLGNALCYIVSGSILLVVGVIITSLTFQNLDGTDSENKERLVLVEYIGL